MILNHSEIPKALSIILIPIAIVGAIKDGIAKVKEKIKGKK